MKGVVRMVARRSLAIGLAVGALVLTACRDDRPTTARPAARSPTTTASATTPAAPGTVSVTVTDLTGRLGSKVAGILQRWDEQKTKVGGFVASVGADPFSFTEPVRVGSPLWGEAPGPVAQLPTGTYTLDVYVSSALHPYSDWMPAEPVEAWCHVDLQVFPGEETAVRMRDVPPREVPTAPPVGCPVA